MEPISQELTNIETRLETATPDPKFNAELVWEVKRFNSEYSGTIKEIRQCQKVTENFDRIINGFIPQGRKLAEVLWQNFETFGLWNAETEKISDLATKTLTPRQFISDAVDAVLIGCECRKR